MLIFTAVLESWTVPGEHTQSFAKWEAAEAWLRDQFAEYLLTDVQEELDNEDSSIHDVDDWLFDAIDRIKAGAAPVDDYILVIDTFNDIKEWAASIEIIASELDISDQILAERERIAAALNDEADLIPCAEDAEVTRSNARLVRADFSYEEADRLAELEGLS
jgi:hypothetical protein